MDIKNFFAFNKKIFINIFLLIILCVSLALIETVQAQEFDQKNFDNNSANVTNKWFPLRPGTQYIYKGFTQEEGKKIPHTVITTVTDLTKKIDNIRSVVIFEQDYSDSKLTEVELAFFAQDINGNVWQLGQYSESFDSGELLGGRAWLVGHLEGAKAGIIMPANPQPGTPKYAEGYAPPPFKWTDSAQVVQTGQKRKVPAGNFADVLVINESDQEEPNSIQIKYYAPDVGNIDVGWKGKDKIEETLHLFSIEKLSAEALAKIREEALTLEKRAYVYGQTPPAEKSN